MPVVMTIEEAKKILVDAEVPIIEERGWATTWEHSWWSLEHSSTYSIQAHITSRGGEQRK